MTRVASPAIHDILVTIERLQSKMAGKTFAEFEVDWEFRFVIQRAIEIISEATRRIPDELKAMRPEIRWSSIAGISNVLRHEYHTVSNKVVWDVVQAELAPLKAAIEAIAARVDKPDK
jgi:uncharacterized protein with HEPN domain